MGFAVAYTTTNEHGQTVTRWTPPFPTHQEARAERERMNKAGAHAFAISSASAQLPDEIIPPLSPQSVARIQAEFERYGAE